MTTPSQLAHQQAAAYIGSGKKLTLKLDPCHTLALITGIQFASCHPHLNKLTCALLCRLAIALQEKLAGQHGAEFDLAVDAGWLQEIALTPCDLTFSAN